MAPIVSAEMSSALNMSCSRTDVAGVILDVVVVNLHQAQPLRQGDILHGLGQVDHPGELCPQHVVSPRRLNDRGRLVSNF